MSWENILKSDTKITKRINYRDLLYRDISEGEGDPRLWEHLRGNGNLTEQDIEDIIEIEDHIESTGGEMLPRFENNMEDKIEDIERVVERLVNTKEYKDKERMKNSIENMMYSVVNDIQFYEGKGVKPYILNRYIKRLREATKKVEDSMDE
tara:strand:- start:52 stop:504 length:453 start_codon:yes stop_codon:yes gene_type:complete